MQRMKVVVLGVGNTLLTDEGVGVRAIEKLEADYVLPPDVTVIDGGTSAMEILEDLENLDALVIADAVFAHQDPGTLVKLEGDAVPAFFKRNMSPHQVGLSDVLAALQFNDRDPKKTVICGIKPVSMQLGMELTPEVQAQLPALVDMVVGELRALGLDVGRR
jgi:hydrogenase maturation protease